MSMPWADWQFWLVSLIAAAAAWWVLKPMIPKRRSGRNAGTQTKVKLTIGGQKR